MSVSEASDLYYEMPCTCISDSVRISNELGMGNAKAAKFSIKVALVTSIIIGIIFWILCMVFSGEIPYLFTSSEAVAEYVSRLHVLLAFSMFLNSIYPVLTGKYFIPILLLYERFPVYFLHCFNSKYLRIYFMQLFDRSP